MGTGAITSYIDVAQLTLYVFWFFFFALVYWIRREDKREGYPVESLRLDPELRDKRLSRTIRPPGCLCCAEWRRHRARPWTTSIEWKSWACSRVKSRVRLLYPSAIDVRPLWNPCSPTSGSCEWAICRRPNPAASKAFTASPTMSSTLRSPSRAGGVPEARSPDHALAEEEPQDDDDRQDGGGAQARRPPGADGQATVHLGQRQSDVQDAQHRLLLGVGVTGRLPAAWLVVDRVDGAQHA